MTSCCSRLCYEISRSNWCFCTNLKQRILFWHRLLLNWRSVLLKLWILLCLRLINLTSLLIDMFTRWHKSTDWTSTLVFREFKSKILTCLMNLLQLFFFDMSCNFFIVEESFLRLLKPTKLLLIWINISFICILFTCFCIGLARWAQNTFLLLLLLNLLDSRCNWRLNSWTLHQLILNLSRWWSLSTSWSLASGCSLWTLDLFFVLFLVTHLSNGSYVYIL